MTLGMIGLGKMGGNMARRLLRKGHHVVGYNLTPEPIEELKTHGGSGASDLEELVEQLDPPRSIWMMIPAGNPVDQTIAGLVPLLDERDVLIDGGNSHYRDTVRREDELREAVLHYVDVGVSGGVWGLEEGYSLMVGGPEEVVEVLRPIFEALAPAPDKGWGHVGETGAGHFVKMVHNGIEYGMMQALAEGFALMEAKEDMALDLHQVAEVWRHGSVVRSWLLDLVARALEENPDLSGLAPYVPDSGEGRWTVQEAIDLAVPIPVIAEALMQRFQSRQEDDFGYRLLSALRFQFGGHPVRRREG